MSIPGHSFSIDKILVGKAIAFGPKGQLSAIGKKAVSGSLFVTKVGFAEDEQADPRHHGGPEKALHHYPADHYPIWAAEYPNISHENLRVGGFGENISTTGLTERNVCIGDIFRLGKALVQVAQGRQPCWKLNVRFGLPKMAATVQKSGRSGWYYRVLEEGSLQAGDQLTLTERPNPEWSLARIQHVLYVDTLNKEALSELSELKELAANWQALAQKRLSKLEVEDWAPRLETPAI